VTTTDRRRLLVQQAVFAPLLLAAFLSLTGFTGAVAYMSIERPWAFQKIRALPQSAMKLFVANSAQSPAKAEILPG
jgi:hypothetical protein